MSKKVVQVVVGLPVAGPFDYSVDETLASKIAVGCRVKISFGRRQRAGFVVGLVAKSQYRNLKPVLRVLDNIPALDEGMLELSRQIAQYYFCSQGEAIETILPGVLRKPRELTLSHTGNSFQSKEETVSNQTGKWGGAAAKHALVHDPAVDRKGEGWVIERIKAVLAAGQGVIYLVPEAALIEKTLGRLKTCISQEMLVDKRLSPKEELENWIRLKNSEVSFVIGTRSAVFAPLTNLGLIVVSGEENPAYKQEQSPFYHVREMALLRSRISSCGVIFISAAPSAEIWEAARKKIGLFSFTDRNAAKTQIVDLSNYNPRKSSILSVPLRNQMQKILDTGGRLMIFMNRKGFSLRTHCQHCGHIVQCERCNVNLTYLYSKKKLVCRLCGFKTNLPGVCPQCGSSYMRSVGMGVEKLASEVSRQFPQARVEHYDSDSPQIPQDFNVLIATQAVFKIVDEFSFKLIALVRMDAELSRQDFHGGHRAFSLLVHLHRAAEEKLLIQTKLPDNYCVKAARKMDFKYFYRQELSLRKEIGLPPYRHLVSIGFRAVKEDAAFEAARDLFTVLREKVPKGIEVFDPQPDVIPKLRGKYRFTILVKAKSAPPMLKFLRKTIKGTSRKKNVTISVNPEYSPGLFLEK